MLYERPTLWLAAVLAGDAFLFEVTSFFKAVATACGCGRGRLRRGARGAVTVLPEWRFLFAEGILPLNHFRKLLYC